MRLIAVAVLALLAGCVTTQFTPIAEAETESGVSVLYDYPAAPYRKLGLIDLDYYKPGWRAPTITDAFPKLKTKVREVGGNAFIVRGQRPGQVQSRSIIVSAEVLTVQWPAKPSP